MSFNIKKRNFLLASVLLGNKGIIASTELARSDGD